MSGSDAHFADPPPPAPATYASEDIEDFFENAALSLHWVGADGMILRANQFELDFLGYARDEYEGHHIAEFHVDRDVIEDILRRLSAGETLSDYEARLRAKDGSIKHVLINSNVRWVDGQFAHTRCFTRDITDRVMAEQALADANRDLERKVEQRTKELRRANASLRELVELKTRFVAMVSHELRTPLTSISGFSVTMERYWTSLPDDRKREFVRLISEQSNRLARLVDDLLTLSRVHSGVLDVRPTAVPLREAAEQAVAAIGVRGVRIAAAADATALVDRHHLHQMLTNYLTNAAKYGTPPVEISVATADGYAEIRVADAGPGIGDDFVAHLFEEFAMADTASDEPPRGTGLGLAIVRHLAHANGGEAWYEPNSPRGAVFSLRLPRP